MGNEVKDSFGIKNSYLLFPLSNINQTNVKSSFYNRLMYVLDYKSTLEFITY